MVSNDSVVDSMPGFRPRIPGSIISLADNFVLRDTLIDFVS